MSNQVYSNDGDPYWLSARGLDKISFNKLPAPPLGYLNKGILYELNDGKLYFNGTELGASTPGIAAPVTSVLQDEIVTYGNTGGTQASSSGIVAKSYGANNTGIVLSNRGHTGLFTNAVAIGSDIGYTGGSHEGVYLGRNVATNCASNVESVVIGKDILTSLTSPFADNYANVFIGVRIGNTGLWQAGAANVGIGSDVLSGGCGNNNIAIGGSNGLNMTGGSYNTLIGNGVGNQLTMGSSNVFLGPGAGNGIDTGDFNIVIGTNETLGATATGLIKLGGSNTTDAYVRGIYNNTGHTGTPQAVMVDSAHKLCSIPFGESMPIGEIYFNSFSVPYTLALTLNTPATIAPTSTLVTSSGSIFSSPSAGQLKYLGMHTAYAHVAVSMSGLLAAGTNVNLEFFLQDNGNPVAGSYFRRRFASSTEYATLAYHKVVQLAPDDVITIACTNISDSNDLVLGNFNIVAVVGH